jgi:hypothetical protein
MPSLLSSPLQSNAILRTTLLAASLLIVTFGTSGCSEKSKSSTRTASISYPSVGYVSLVKVEELDPKMSILQSVDNAIEVNAQFEPVRTGRPNDRGAESYIDNVSALGSVKMRTDFQDAQRANLVAIGTVVLGELSQRLELADHGQLAAMRSERIAEGNLLFQKNEADLEQQAIVSADQSTTDTARIASLRMQIAALRLDQNPPPTAPKGYWAQLEGERQTELDRVLNSYNLTLNVIYAKRDLLIEQERAAIDAGIESDVNGAKATMTDARNQAVLRAEARLNKEQSVLNAEDNRVYRDAEAAILPTVWPNTKVASTGSLTVQENNNIADQTAALELYRTNLEAGILADAYATVNAISRELHMKIVGERAGVPDVTPIVVESIRDRTWKVT